ncbi:MAG: cyanophycin synthetase [Fimbriimonas sp.]
MELNVENVTQPQNRIESQSRPARTGAENPKPARIEEVRVYRGPSPYGYRPVVRFKFDLGALEAYPTTRIEGFTERLLEFVPTLGEHGCCYGEPGGFVRRLHDGTWLGHVAEHVAMELQCLAGTHVTYGKTRSTGDTSGVYNVVYSYTEERVGLLAGWLALRLIQSLLPEPLRTVEGMEKFVPRDAEPLAEPDAPFDFTAEFEALVRVAQRLALGPTTRSLVDEAKRRGIPAIRLDDQSLVQLGYGRYQKRIRASVTGMTSHIGLDCAGDKALTSKLLADSGIPVPKGWVVRTAEEAVAAAKRIGFPVVTKPLDGNHGRGVSLDLSTPEEVAWGFEQAVAHSRKVIVEAFFHGHDYRVLVVNGQVVAASHRVPAHVVGDGRHTIAELVERVNQDPRRGIGHEKVMTRITIGAQAEKLMKCAGYRLDTVLPEGETFLLAPTANMSTGGTAIDVTDQMHPDNREICRRAALIIGLDVAGIDLITPDISKPLSEVGGGICEVNAGPGFRMHLQPSEGTPRNVAKPVIDMLFPDDVPCRIPIVAITGTNGKTTTSRMVAHILKMTGKRVGLTTSSGIYINGEKYLEGDTTGPWSAKVVLRDPTIDAAVLETARGGILREGLGFDRCDVGCVLNVTEDHLGVGGIDSVEDLAWVKSLVVEVVDDGGVSVLNADDPLVARMRRKAGGRIVYFSMRGGEGSPRVLQDHIRSGGTAVVVQPGVKGDMLTIYDGEHYLPLLWAHEIPATLGGTAGFNIENALAAAAIAYGMRVPVETIRQALRTFVTTFHHNPGRLNVYDGHPFRVILDYAHNPDGMNKFIAMVNKMRPNHQRIIAVTTGTGDRRDDDIRALGRIVGEVADEMIIKETTLLRGRNPGEIPRLVAEGARAAGMTDAQLSYIDNECESVVEAMRRARPGDLLIVFCDNYKTCWNCITSFQPAPANSAVMI